MAYSLIGTHPGLIHRKDFLIPSCSMNNRDGKMCTVLETCFFFLYYAKF